MPDLPTWNAAGQPDNLAAAAYDALEWLRFTLRLPSLEHSPILRSRLTAASNQLAHFLRIPEEAPIVAEIVASSGDSTAKQLKEACESCLAYFEAAWEKTGDHPASHYAEYVHELKAALGRAENA